MSTSFRTHHCLPLIAFFLFANNTFSQRVGIGTTTPVYKLDVRNGSINTDSVYRINGSTVLSEKTGNYFIGAGDVINLANGSHNIAIGRESLQSNVNGSDNIGIGIHTLRLNTGDGNTAIGAFSLRLNVQQGYSTAVGYSALTKNINGGNTAVGAQSLANNTLGYSLVGVGESAMEQNTTGTFNTATGAIALHDNTIGSANTAFGYHAGGRIQTASYNTTFGTEAGSDQKMGWNNTLIGARADVQFEGQFNCIAIGNEALATDNSKVRIGNSSNWSYEAYANWTNISDSRYKKNIVENVPGIEFIKRLRPVTYQLDVTALALKEARGSLQATGSPMQKAIAEKEAMVWTGFIAQEVEQAARQEGFDFSGVDKPRNEYSHYGLRYAEFVVPLVKAVQEQQQMIEELRKEIAELKKKIASSR